MTPASESTDVGRGIRAGIVAYVLWGLLTIYWKQLSDFNAVELIAWRTISAALVMAIVVSLRTRWPVIRDAFADRALTARIAVAALLLTANWTSYVYAVVHDRVIETALGYFMAPLGTMLLGIVVLKERPSGAQKAALVLAAVAVVESSVSYGRPPVAALVIAVTWSLYGLLKRRVPLPAIESFAAESFVLVLPAIVVAVVAAGRPRASAQRRRRRARARVALRRRDRGAADPVRLRRDACPVHHARPAAVPRADDQLPARLGACTTRSCRCPASSDSDSCGWRCSSSRSTACAARSPSGRPPASRRCPPISLGRATPLPLPLPDPRMFRCVA